MLFAFPAVVYAKALQCARTVSANEFEAGVLGLAAQGQVFLRCSVLGTPTGVRPGNLFARSMPRAVSCFWLLQQMCRRSFYRSRALASAATCNTATESVRQSALYGMLASANGLRSSTASP